MTDQVLHKRRRNSAHTSARKLQRLSSTANDGEYLSHDDQTRPIDLLSTSNKSSAHKAYAVACDTCRHKKVKCDEGRPLCSYCNRHGFRCTFPEDPRTRILRENSGDLVALLLDRFAQIERKIEGLHRRLDCQQAESTNSNREGLQNSKTGGPLSANHVTGDTILFGRNDHTIPASLNPEIELDEILDGELGSSAISLSQEEGSIACEELRQPLPDLLAATPPTEAKDLIPFVDDFLELPRLLFPLICKSTAYKVAGVVQQEGFSTNLYSCYALLMVALSKAFSDVSSTESGLADFQRATSMLGRLNAQLGLEYVQVQILSSLFLLKKGRLINFSMALHTACTSLYTLIIRDNASGVRRNKAEQNNIMSCYWICYNLERELVFEVDQTLPQSSLGLLEDNFPLPLGCDISRSSDLPPRIRDEVMLFMSEIALKRILNRILTISNSTNYRSLCSTSTQNHFEEGLPSVQIELQNQLCDWLHRLPSCLEWSTGPDKHGVVANPVTTRLRLIYWFARFALVRPVLSEIMHKDQARQFQLSTLKAFQDGILSAFTLLRVFVWENPDIDFIMGNRILSAFDVVQTSIRLGCHPALDEEHSRDLSHTALKLLWKKMAGKSEWIALKIRAILQTERTNEE